MNIQLAFGLLMVGVSTAPSTCQQQPEAQETCLAEIEEYRAEREAYFKKRVTDLRQEAASTNPPIARTQGFLVFQQEIEEYENRFRVMTQRCPAALAKTAIDPEAPTEVVKP